MFYVHYRRTTGTKPRSRAIRIEAKSVFLLALVCGEIQQRYYKSVRTLTTFWVAPQAWWANLDKMRVYDFTRDIFLSLCIL